MYEIKITFVSSSVRQNIFNNKFVDCWRENPLNSRCANEMFSIKLPRQLKQAVQKLPEPQSLKRVVDPLDQGCFVVCLT